ncbi:MAG: DUF4287 domain-containing protein [Deltaproteobacteria bacterium]|nr:DUF4287 domain-containing protein [Deltaproteobacteria bacterium]
MAKPGKIEKIGRVTSRSVLKCTGRGWDEWIRILDEAGARGLTHKEIVALLRKRYKLGPWWEQGVTHGYEVHIERRVDGQDAKGKYSTAATRTFPIDVKAAWKLLVSPAGLAAWLKPLAPFEVKPGASYEVRGGVFGEVRTMKPGKFARLAWQETEWPAATIVYALVVARPKGKSVVVLQHLGLHDGKLHARMRAHWKSALEDLLALAGAQS